MARFPFDVFDEDPRGPLDALVERRRREAQRLFDLHGSLHPETLLALARLAGSLRFAGRLVEALGVHRAVLVGLEQADPVSGLAALSDQGITLIALGRFGEAFDDQERAFRQLRVVANALDFRSVVAATNLAYTFQVIGRPRDAIEFYTPLADEVRHAYGPDHPHTDIVQSRLAGAYDASGDRESAQTLWFRVVESRRRMYGEHDTRILAAEANVAETMRAAGMLSSARALHEGVLDRLVALVGDRHLSTLGVKEGLAMTLAAQGELGAARALATEVLAGRTSALGELHPQTLAAMRGLTRIARVDRHLGDALDYAQRAAVAHEQALGSSHPDTIAALGELGEVLASAGEHRRAGGLLGQVLDMRGTAHLDEMFGAGRPLENVAAAMTARDEFLEGELAQPPINALATGADELISRTPHLEVNTRGPLIPGARFGVGVWVDAGMPSEGEEAQPIELELPPWVAIVELEVWLVASMHFEVLGATIQTLALDRREKCSRRLLYELEVSENAGEIADETPWVTAAFAFNGWPCGRVTRPVALAAEAVSAR